MQNDFSPQHHCASHPPTSHPRPSVLMVIGDGAYHGSSGRIHAAGGRDRRGGGRIADGDSSQIRSGTRLRRRILGPLRWITSRRRVDFKGELYVADTEDQSIRLDPSTLCSESELQVNDSEPESSPWSCQRRPRRIGPLRRSLLHIVDWGKWRTVLWIIYESWMYLFLETSFTSSNKCLQMSMFSF
jgi:hypothetical protein